MLTEEEKEELQRERFESKHRCRELWDTIHLTRGILKSYENAHYHWNERFKKADRRLAEEEKLTKVPTPGQGPRQTALVLSKEQIMEIAATLGVDVTIEGEGGELDESS